ncbi:MAG: NAD(P) transhydrogenase subunit alpha [Myxococcales bacterium]|nr:NAD(P) transhydrogenase subunit alpha [Myxococcales bacterium]MCZ6715317.1 NAD(P) transhydrogenase subunit alpha [Deltaproteobacteria bacterium]MCZ6823305.1 NAD(P) transhydrogenase subunit alpha [Deltaproteobacteria bacterium]
MEESFALIITIFVLAMFVGFEVITKVPPTLHTPLMSGSNAISGITIIGALISAAAENITLSSTLGIVAVALATVNVVGGFLVTDRMLKMFTSKRSKENR